MRSFVKTLIISMALLGVSAFVWAQAAGDFQVITLAGRMLNPQGQALEEYDYITKGMRYRLMPQCSAEISSLDGRIIYKITGPGILELEAGQITLNGKPVAGIEAKSSLDGVKAAKGSGSLAGMVMRGDEGVTLKISGPKGGQKELPLYSGYYALVIGAGAYRAGWPVLPNPTKDALQVAKALESLGWDVDTLLEPDSDHLKQRLNQLIVEQGRKTDKAILVWYSGHGHTLIEADGSRLGYIVPVDAPNPHEDELGFMAKGVSMRQVETVARRIRSKHVLMIFDSCFSGALFTLTRAVPSPFIEEKVSRPVRQFITAGTENEKVPDASVFKTVFIQGIKDRSADLNRDGYVTGEELGSYLQEKVVNYSNKAQHPQFGKINNPYLDKGDFVFAPLYEPEPKGVARLPPAVKASDHGQARQKINLLLKSAEANFAARRLSSPQGNNALSDYNQVLRMDPLNQKAQRGLKRIVDEYVDLALDRLKAGDFDRAGQYLKRASRISEADSKVLAAWDQLKSAQAKPDASPARQLKDQKNGLLNQPAGRFEITASGVIRDHKTDLEWCVGPDKDLNWYEAEDWMKGVTLDGGGWRLPSHDELKMLQGGIQGEKAHGGVIKISGEWVWTGEIVKNIYGMVPDVRRVIEAWIFNMKSGETLRIKPTTKSSSRVLVVRTAPKHAVARPGQTKPADESNRPLSISASGRFSKYSSGVISDSLTGLEWFVGPDKDIDWHQSEIWARNLEAAAGGWRLPTREELKGLYNQGDAKEPRAVFKISGSWIWSGDVYRDEIGSSNGKVYGAWIFNPAENQWLRFSPGIKSSSRTFAVRSAKGEAALLAAQPKPTGQPRRISPLETSKEPGRFVKNPSGVIRDNRTGLEWLLGPDKDQNWYEAKEWLMDLGVAGGGWRLPGKEELRGIYQDGGMVSGPAASVEHRADWIWTNDIREVDDTWNGRGTVVVEAGIYNFKKDEFMMVTPVSGGHTRVLAVRRAKRAKK